ETIVPVVDRHVGFSNHPRLHGGLEARYHRDPVGRLIIASERDPLDEDGRILYQQPGFAHRQVALGIHPQGSFEQAFAFGARLQLEYVHAAALELPQALIVELVVLGNDGERDVVRLAYLNLGVQVAGDYLVLDGPVSFEKEDVIGNAAQPGDAP